MLEYRFGGLNIAAVLDLPVADALEFFGAGEAKTPAAHAILRRMADVALGYLRLDQPLTTAMAHADRIIDLGHGGGRVVFKGTPAELVAARSTLTGEHLAAFVANGA